MNIFELFKAAFKASARFVEPKNKKEKIEFDRYPAMHMHPKASKRDKMHWRVIPRTYGTKEE